MRKLNFEGTKSKKEKYQNFEFKFDDGKVCIFNKEGIEIACITDGELFFKAAYKKDFEGVTKFKSGKLKKSEEGYAFIFEGSLAIDLEHSFAKKLGECIISVAESPGLRLQLVDGGHDLLTTKEILKALPQRQRALDTLHLNFNAFCQDKEPIVGDEMIEILLKGCSSKANHVIIENLKVSSLFMRNTLQTLKDGVSLTFFKCLIETFSDENKKSSDSETYETKQLVSCYKKAEIEESLIEEIKFHRCEIEDENQNKTDVFKTSLENKRTKYSRITENRKDQYFEMVRTNRQTWSKKQPIGRTKAILYCIQQIKFAFVLSNLKRIVFEKIGKYSDSDLKNVSL